MSNSSETFQIPLEAAEIYESRFVPALFAEWAPHLVDMADVSPGQSVLDVACGTGIVARTAAERVGPSGRVVGLDLNPSMLTVAQRVGPDIEWRQGDVAAMPFSDGSFDAVLCQMALMFFPDPVVALREMGRVAATAGVVGIVVPGSLASQPAYGPFVELAARHAGPDVVSLLSTYWRCGDLDELTSTIEAAGLRLVGSRTRLGTARFGSVDELVATEVEGTPLIERIDNETYERIREGARTVLARYVTESGALEAPIECHIIVAQPAR
ncbi:MAG: class I SAM-dependent methyltransferase [Acidimicrobiia bacterium]